MTVTKLAGFYDKKEEARQPWRMTSLGAECVGSVTTNYTFSLICGNKESVSTLTTLAILLWRQLPHFTIQLKPDRNTKLKKKVPFLSLKQRSLFSLMKLRKINKSSSSQWVSVFVVEMVIISLIYPITYIIFVLQNVTFFPNSRYIFFILTHNLILLQEEVWGCGGVIPGIHKPKIRRSRHKLRPRTLYLWQFQDIMSGGSSVCTLNSLLAGRSRDRGWVPGKKKNGNYLF